MKIVRSKVKVTKIIKKQQGNQSICGIVFLRDVCILI